jgi:hypothetical protein
MSWDVKDITEAEQVEKVTEADVEAAEQEAADAEAEVNALEERVLAGDESVTADAIEKQRGLSRFAKLLAQRTARKAERAKQAARLKACDALRQEIEAHSTEVGPKLAKALRKAEAALTEVFRIEYERNVQVGQWRRRASELGVPEHRSPFAPPAEHAHLALNRRQVIAGRRRLDSTIEVDSWVQMVVKRAKEGGRGILYDGVRSTDDPAEYATKVDAEENADPDADAEFYQNTETGSIRQFGPGHAPVDDPTMRKISRREAEHATW